MPKWIHDRAEHLLAKNPSMPKGEAFAIATQQSHALNKSPKDYGTAHGRAEAKDKYDTPKDDKKTANPGSLSSKKMEKGAGWNDQLHGGRADDKKPEDFPSSSVAEGAKHEREHTSSEHIAKEIAMDHLVEDPHYYKKLEKLEKKAMFDAFSDEIEKIALNMGDLSPVVTKALTGAGVGASVGALGNVALERYTHPDDMPHGYVSHPHYLQAALHGALGGAALGGVAGGAHHLLKEPPSSSLRDHAESLFNKVRGAGSALQDAGGFEGVVNKGLEHAMQVPEYIRQGASAARTGRQILDDSGKIVSTIGAGVKGMGEAGWAGIKERTGNIYRSLKGNPEEFANHLEGATKGLQEVINAPGAKPIPGPVYTNAMEALLGKAPSAAQTAEQELRNAAQENLGRADYKRMAAEMRNAPGVPTIEPPRGNVGYAVGAR